MKFHRTISILILILFFVQVNVNEAICGSTQPTIEIGLNDKAKGKKHKKKLEEFKASVSPTDDLSSFNYHEISYVINADFATVWNCYTTTNPNAVWDGPLNTYSRSYSRNSDMNYTSGDEKQPKAELDMVYELKLNFSKVFNIIVTFQITKLDCDEKVIEFTYGQDNKSHDFQRMVFQPDGDKTRIIHSTRFKSDNKFRDTRIYPKYHEKCLNEYHGNLRAIAEHK